MLTIKDGKGSGNKVEVNSDNELVVRSLSTTPLEYASAKGNAYVWSMSDEALTQFNTAIAVINYSNELLYFDKAVIYSDTSFEVTVRIENGNTATNEITAVNLQGGSSNTISGVKGHYNQGTTSFSNNLYDVHIPSFTPVEINLRGICGKNGNGVGIYCDTASVTMTASIFAYKL